LVIRNYKTHKQQWVISMVSNNKEPENCWEFWNCPKKARNSCPAFLTYHGMNCYDFAQNHCPRAEKSFKHCKECPWYKKVTHELIPKL
jgi:hypothetical protein